MEIDIVAVERNCHTIPLLSITPRSTGEGSSESSQPFPVLFSWFKITFQTRDLSNLRKTDRLLRLYSQMLMQFVLVFIIKKPRSK